MTRCLFIHHSVGRNLVSDGGLRAELAGVMPDLELWDHDYNRIGLTDPTGRKLGVSFPIPDDNTDPVGLLSLFASHEAPPARGLEQIDSFDAVALKSCFPNSRIRSVAELASLKETYQRLFDAFGRREPKSHLLLTSPPLARLRSRPDNNRRASELAMWLMAADRPDNVRVFNLFHELADPADGFALRRRYQRALPLDSHPRRIASLEIAPRFAAALGALVDERRNQ